MPDPRKIDRSWKSVLNLWVGRFRTSQFALHASELEVVRLRKVLVAATLMLTDEQLALLAEQHGTVDTSQPDQVGFPHTTTEESG